MQKEREIHDFGRRLAEMLGKEFYGSVQFNIQGGNHVNANVVETLRPQKPDSEKERFTNENSEKRI